MELKGTVTLDEKTMHEMRETIREEVIEDIKKNGNYSSEIKIYLSDCDFSSYIMMIKETIDDVIKKTNEEDIHFKSEGDKWRKLQIINAILKL